MPKNWNRRFKYNREKIKTGDVYELAEVVRNLAIREWEKGLSTGEKQMYTRAKKILASEFMYALDKDEEGAEEYIDELLEERFGAKATAFDGGAHGARGGPPGNGGDRGRRPGARPGSRGSEGAGGGRRPSPDRLVRGGVRRRGERPRRGHRRARRLRGCARGRRAEAGGELPITCDRGIGSRGESVGIGLEWVETDLVAVHDAARPLVTPELIEALIARPARVPGPTG